MSDRSSILVVDADAAHVHGISQLLGTGTWEVLPAWSLNEAVQTLHEHRPDVVLLSLDLPDTDPERSLSRIGRRFPGVPVVTYGRSPTTAAVVAAMRRGAVDVLPWPPDPAALPRVLRRTLEEADPETAYVDDGRRGQKRVDFSQMRTRSPRMLEVFDKVRAVAGTDATVLIRGETGTGKELISRAIHERSRRQDKPFISVNCGAFTESLLESELFGHERGSFTGAAGRRQGVFEMADGGTLFLDELGETTLNVQVNLLRVLEEMAFRRVGGHDRVSVDVRVVAATNVALEQAVQAGKFREDLYYRLNVFPIFLPPLRERRTDIPLLMRHFLDEAAQRFERPPAPTISVEALEAIVGYAWPGNVRQLRAFCERWAITHSGQILQADELPAAMVTGASEAAGIDPFNIDSDQPLSHTTERLLHQVERTYLHRVLKRHRGHMEATAQAAGITRRTLYTKMKSYGLEAASYRQK